MLEIVTGIGIFIIYLVNYYLYGFFLQKIAKVKKISLSLSLVGGFFLYAITFFDIVLPLKKLQLPLEDITFIWCIANTIILCSIIFLWNRELLQCIRECLCNLRKIKLTAVIITGVTVLEICFEELYGRILGGENAAYYIGYVSTAIHKGYLGLYEPLSGLKSSSFHSAYFLQTYLDHSAVISFLTNVHPLIEIRSIIPAITIIISNIVIWKIADYIFKENLHKCYFFVAYNAIKLCFSSCLLLPGFYSLFRAFEGKNIFASILLPICFLCFWKMYDYPSDKYNILLLLVSIIGSYTFSMSTMFIIPFVVLGYSPMIIIKKDRKVVVNFIICMLPCVIVALYYILAVKGVISLRIR